MCKLFSWSLFVGVLFVGTLFAGSFSALADVMPLRVLIDVRSNHSDGAHDFNTLAALAEKRDIDVLVFTEHDRFSILLGIEPVAKILGYQMQHPSLYVTGVEKFFDDLAALRKERPGMLFMAATESTPGYDWFGIPFRDLTLHNAERHIIALGAERAEQIQALPSFDLRHAHGPVALSMVFWFLLVGGMLIILLRRRKKVVAMLLFASFIAFMATWLTRGTVDADADFIRVAEQQGLFTIWAHPGTLSGSRPGPMGVQLDTPPYSQRVFHEPTANAFAAIYGDTNTYTNPGDLWDRYMADYMMGLHNAPIWAVSSGDYHQEGQSGEFLGNFPMDVWAQERSAVAVLKALRGGHMVAWHASKGKNFRVGRLDLQDASGKKLLPGDEALVSSELMLSFLLQEMPVSGRGGLADKPVRARLIVDGEVLKNVQMRLGQLLKLRLHLTPGAHVLRVDVPNQWLGGMIANPFLLRVAN
ncbi:MAG: hypothetical protein Q9M25_09965 [Mariprofundaceae bacterium]|nr:hypothetical protein [Mariprofundaceae bacterium]